MSFLYFFRENARWLAGGFLLTFFSSFGQTFFISLSAGNIRQEYALSHGTFGMIYMLATLASALTMPRFGQIVDRYSARTVTLIIVPMLALACVSMALSTSIVLLCVTIYLLRLFGQGMMTQNALTAMGRWFSAQRGRAVSLTVLGQNASEAVLPLIFVSLAGLVGWRGSWLVGAGFLVLVALPLIAGLVAVERAPRSSDPAPRRATGRNWTRAEVVRDPLFYALLLGVMAPGFISTTIFFHQVYLVELRGWSLEVFASSFTFMAVMTVSFALISGQLIDRFSAVALLPVFLLPLAAACLTLAAFDAQWISFIFMGMLGISYGFSSTLFGAVWPEIYGTRHLGAVRALTVAIMVFATAMGPGLTGYLIDLGVSYPLQIAAMGFYCLAASALMLFVSRRLAARALQWDEASATSAP
ncbi:MFS transporter [Chelativorans sp. M5D2P16]|uniref:MFS transporter n=1 Tax=Chelativorans sp. M5D2P16 TaxID=3095678 RepID=UPI002ACAEEFA|nr:MFS transporter [Chelativorans sp. M5D2P16]MDZ5697759.1 MFS transporter [Chelativorans sp. M5D2P16]